jgi:hypothetical protein
MLEVEAKAATGRTRNPGAGSPEARRPATKDAEP